MVRGGGQEGKHQSELMMLLAWPGEHKGEEDGQTLSFQ